MKTTYQKIAILFAALALILMPSCSNEEYLDAPAPTPDREGVITFRIQGKKQPVSYAIATENENAVDSLSIYMFNDRSAESQPNLLLNTFHIGKTGLAQTGADLTATINVADRSGKHIFYFVANGKGNASALENVNLGTTTEDDFRERLTDIQAGLIASPLLMTARQEIVDVKNPTDTEKKVKLYRRVARFDVVNDASKSNFTIDNILIANATTQGNIFGNAINMPEQTLATGKLPIIKNNDPTDFNTGTPATSAFYLYPTKLGENQTMISFEGEFMGERNIYNLRSDINIEANKRYILNVKKDEHANTIDLRIEVEDWEDDGSTHEVERGTDDVTLSEIAMTGGTGVVVGNMYYDITNIDEETTLSFTVESYQASGTTPRITGNVDDLPDFRVTASTPVLTYAAHYRQEYAIVIPKRTDLEIGIDILIEIVNQSKPEQPLSITIHADEILGKYYPGTKLEPVVVSGVTWAPVNVGATEIGTTITDTHMGEFFQWGRNLAFTCTGAVITIYGPRTEDDIAQNYPNRFITSSANHDDWLTPQDNTLWSGAKQQGPCPDGWRVPTKAELDKLVNAKNKSWDAFYKSYRFKSDYNEGELYFPVAGYRHYNDGKVVLQGVEGHYWSSDGNETPSYLCVRSNGLSLIESTRTTGQSVRCVKK